MNWVCAYKGLTWNTMAKFPDINNLVPFPVDMTSQHSHESALDSFFVYCPELGQKEGTVRCGWHGKSRLSWAGTQFIVHEVSDFCWTFLFGRRKERFSTISQKIFLWPEKSETLDCAKLWSTSPRPFLRTSHVKRSIRKRRDRFFSSLNLEYGWFLWVWFQLIHSFHKYTLFIAIIFSSRNHHRR